MSEKDREKFIRSMNYSLTKMIKEEKDVSRVSETFHELSQKGKVCMVIYEGQRLIELKIPYNQLYEEFQNLVDKGRKVYRLHE
ncbi:hypothetical protein CMI39_01835 [Candidatus Pacearchaeota archaeon]|jgi:hypothetical protein|nr:hypothetical protein [Candidatus Pacearchaeota archaeon]|tara:strand:+ start:7298 stop:7546 length:249 start_codon:yes stop_codon:yes gene_type:complete